jgi:acetyl esterase/lipase
LIALCGICITFGCSGVSNESPRRRAQNPDGKLRENTTMMDREDLDEGTLEAIRAEQHPARDETKASQDVSKELGLVFGKSDGRDLTLDLFTPTEIPSEPRPAIVFLHGGSWLMGNPSQFHFHSAYLAEKYGFFAVGVDYRLSQEAPFPAALQDAKCAVRWVRSQCKEQNIDPNRIAICGGSAGGHLASMILTTAGVAEYEGDGGNDGYGSHVNLGILFNGEYDMWDLVKKGSLIQPMKQFMGAAPKENPDIYTELSSINRIHKDTPPVLLMHGTEDLCVSHEQAIAFHEKLKSFGIHSEIEIYEGKPHAWFNNEPDRTITLKRMEKFLVDQFDLK